ncbi:adenylosuccinate synthase [Metarhizobium album]|uniref:Adenylosuccinate synthetase n=1 Tax=Metarhizobium album TaxID=2182425 RepID=A0A2U2DWT0_9HYPH|nr:adenylosuccinate synthetase [Rhizobium album]PWE57761.1 adenylosuccinate synthase [Rhizobium album]
MATRQAQAVIGAGYGDEGKGLLTDRLACGTADAVVVRSNGGAQAGHTVATPDGRRHVFHHFGSGALAGAPTHLSAFFVAHPMFFQGERQALKALGAELAVSADPRAIVTTPFDMMINQALELSRGTGRHGSCGLGFGEAIERCLRPDHAIRTGDLSKPHLAGCLWCIWTDWVPQRLRGLGLDRLPDDIMRHVDIETVIGRFLRDCEAYLDHVTLRPDSRLGETGQVIFEGAQGLLLDQDYGAFPHVTRSNTGLRNMVSIAREAGIDSIDAHYVTRCYVTRHGAGPLAHEAAGLAGIDMVDPTNAPNAWQGTLRLAPLDLAVLRSAIAHDLQAAASSAVAVAPDLSVTCLDQASCGFALLDGGGPTSVDPQDAGRRIAGGANLPLFGESWGAGRTHFRPVGELARAG